MNETLLESKPPNKNKIPYIPIQPPVEINLCLTCIRPPLHYTDQKKGQQVMYVVTLQTQIVGFPWFKPKLAKTYMHPNPKQLLLAKLDNSLFICFCFCFCNCN